jgi:hypothetical protein
MAFNDIFSEIKQGVINHNRLMKMMVTKAKASNMAKETELLAMQGEIFVSDRYIKLYKKDYTHFYLPNNGAKVNHLTEGKDLRSVILDFLIGTHLPFENVSFEFELSKESFAYSGIEAVCVLAHEELVGDQKVSAIILNTASKIRNIKSESKPNMALSLPSAQSVCIITDEEYLKKNPENAYGILMPDGKIVPNFQNDDSFTQTIMLVINTVIAALCALSCSNVKIESGKLPSEISNKKRIKKGLQPYTQKKYITINTEIVQGEKNANKGSSKSKTTHMRRGHIRNYVESGKRIWVEATIINADKADKANIKTKKYLVK